MRLPCRSSVFRSPGGFIMSQKPYYNHDATWLDRTAHRSPVWGHYSAVLYEHVLQILTEEARGRAPTKHESLKLLDAGCGAGKFSEFTLAAGYQYVGIDESSVAIALGKSHWPSLDLRCIDLAQPMQPASLSADLLDRFDVVTSLNVLHCLTEQRHRIQYLKNLKACAKSDGVLLLTTMCGPITGAFRPSREPRIYLDRQTIVNELAASGWPHVIWENALPADDLNPIPNLELMARATAG